MDYREEIVELFYKLVDNLQKLGLPVSDKYTPRKIQYLVAEAKAGILEKAMEDAIVCFEEADYSTHTISRQHYERMYLSVREIEKHGNKPKAAV